MSRCANMKVTDPSLACPTESDLGEPSRETAVRCRPIGWQNFRRSADSVVARWRPQRHRPDLSHPRSPASARSTHRKTEGARVVLLAGSSGKQW